MKLSLVDGEFLEMFYFWHKLYTLNHLEFPFNLKSTSKTLILFHKFYFIASFWIFLCFPCSFGLRASLGCTIPFCILILSSDSVLESVISFPWNWEVSQDPHPSLGWTPKSPLLQDKEWGHLPQGYIGPLEERDWKNILGLMLLFMF